MSGGTSIAMAVVRVERGAPRPSREQFRRALDEDRRLLHMRPGDADNELIVTGPVPIVVGEAQLDEYVVWER